jgi:YgiT-type zinc finger domain-containing protein
MICFVCKHGETKNSTTTVTLERDKTTLVIKDVPARVCANCGEAYFEPNVTDNLLDMLNGAVAGGVQVEVRSYAIAEVL